MAHRTLGVVENLGRKSMPDLNERIHSWRESISHCDQLQKDDIDELEDHLRDSVSELTAVGLSDEEAFLLAIRRLGNTDAIAAEFAKVNRMSIWLGRLQWMWGGYILVKFVQGFIAALVIPDYTNYLWIRLAIAPISLFLLGMLYLFPCAKLIKNSHRDSHSKKNKANSKTGSISATAAFFVTGLCVFFITSVSVSLNFIPDRAVFQWWREELWLNYYGVLLFHLVLNLPLALVYSLYAVKRTFHSCGGQLASSHTLGDSSLISNAD